MNSITPNNLASLCNSGKNIILLDVRTEIEFRECHSVHARNVPLDRLDPSTEIEKLKINDTEPIYLICKSGSRSSSAYDKFIKAGYSNVINVEGGTEAWIQNGLPVNRGKKVRIPLDSQVRLVIGFFVLLGSLLTASGYPNFVYLTMFFGAGLVFSGLTNFCGLALILGRMPWNKVANQNGATCSR